MFIEVNKIDLVSNLYILYLLASNDCPGIVLRLDPIPCLGIATFFRNLILRSRINDLLHWTSH